MAESVCHCQHALTIILKRDENKNLKSELLSAAEFEMLEDLIEVLKPIEKCTKIISGSSYPTCSVILPAVTYLLEILQICQSQHHPFLNDMCLSMFNELTDLTAPYFQSPLLKASCFMDLRFRSLKFIKDDGERDAAMYSAKSYIKSLFQRMSRDEYARPSKRRKVQSARDGEAISFVCQDSSDDEDNSDKDDSLKPYYEEISAYQKFKLRVDGQFSSLAFYKENSAAFPILSSLVCHHSNFGALRATVQQSP